MQLGLARRRKPAEPAFDPGGALVLFGLALASAYLPDKQRSAVTVVIGELCKTMGYALPTPEQQPPLCGKCAIAEAEHTVGLHEAKV